MNHSQIASEEIIFRPLVFVTVIVDVTKDALVNFSLAWLKQMAYWIEKSNLHLISLLVSKFNSIELAETLTWK